MKFKKKEEVEVTTRMEIKRMSNIFMARGLFDFKISEETPNTYNLEKKMLQALVFF